MVLVHENANMWRLFRPGPTSIFSTDWICIGLAFDSSKNRTFPANFRFTQQGVFFEVVLKRAFVTRMNIFQMEKEDNLAAIPVGEAQALKFYNALHSGKYEEINFENPVNGIQFENYTFVPTLTDFGPGTISVGPMFIYNKSDYIERTLNLVKLIIKSLGGERHLSFENTHGARQKAQGFIFIATALIVCGLLIFSFVRH